MTLLESGIGPSALDAKDQIINEYLDTLPVPEYEVAASIAEQISTVDRPLATTVVLIPVAAAAEAPMIAHSLHEYAKQKTRKPFSVVLGFNIDDSHTSPQEPAVVACLRNAASAQAEYPQLDVRSAFTTYTRPKIGAIRRNLWNGALLALRQEGSVRPNEEIILINHDIDVLDLPYYWIDGVQGHFTDPNTALLPAYGRSRHAFDPSFPNISRYIAWRDFFLDKIGLSYEPAAAIPASFYAENGGFNPVASLNEITSFTRERHPLLIRTGRLQTSPRRIISRLQDPRNSLGEIWTNESFTSNDDCRHPGYVTGLKDKDTTWLLDTIQSGIDYTYGNYIAYLMGLHNRDMIVELSKLADPAQQMTHPDELAQRTRDRFDKFTSISERILRNCLTTRFPELVVDTDLYREQLAHQI